MGSGSKMLVHTVLKLMDDAITTTNASSGAISGSATSWTMQAAPGVLVGRGHPVEHCDLVAAHNGRAVGLG